MAVDYAPPKSVIDDLWDTTALSTYDPLADGLLMAHQKAWVADQSDLKVAEKGRRTGVTWAEAFSSVLTASAKRSAGGDDVYYIGDTKDKGREFINTCAKFAAKIASELLTVEEFLFDDMQEDGSSKQITAWRITFASGFRITALSSNPANIRGLQGIVIIDEAAFHANVAKVLEACLALSIWGGKIRIISTHNGTLNAFNTLIKEVREGKIPGTVHHIPFDDAVAGGLYERVCAVRGWTPSPDGKRAWYNKIRNLYGSRTEAMREELDAIPREGDGTMLALALIEAAQQEEYKVARWAPPPPAGALAFVDWPEELRRAHMALWIAEHVQPVLETFPADTLCAIGGDFAMRQDRAAYAVGYTARNLHRHVPLLVELRECPYDQQKQLLFHIGVFLRDRRRLQGGVLDANGNGMVLAQESRQKFGAERIVELMPSDAWSREMTPKFAAAFGDRTIHLPADIDVRDDLHQFRLVRGVGKIPSDVRTEGTDGGRRHGDAGVALLNFYAATLGGRLEYGYESGAAASHRDPNRPPDDDDDQEGGGLRFGEGCW